MTPEILAGIRQRLLARQQSANLTSQMRADTAPDLQGGVGQPGPDVMPNFNPALTPEAFGQWNPANNVNAFDAPRYSAPASNVNGLPLDVPAANYTPPPYTGEPTVQVPTTFGQPTQPGIPGPPAPSDLMPSLDLATVNAAIRNQGNMPVAPQPQPIAPDLSGGLSANPRVAAPNFAPFQGDYVAPGEGPDADRERPAGLRGGAAQVMGGPRQGADFINLARYSGTPQEAQQMMRDQFSYFLNRPKGR